MAERTTTGRALVAGRALGAVLVLDEPLSFWGGFDPATGKIVDAHHPQRGQIVTGRIVVMPGGRGSSSSSSVLAEGIRAGTAPAAILLPAPDEIIVLGALVVMLLDGKSIPVITVGEAALAELATGDLVAIDKTGTITVSA